MQADPDDDEASWNYDPTAESDDTESDDDEEEDEDEEPDDDEDDGGYYYGYGCLIVSTGAKLPIAAAFTQQKQVDQETARRVTRDALAVEKPVWILGDAAFDMLERVIESVTYEEAGCGKCVQHNRNPARRHFGRRLLECRGYRDSTAV